MNRVGIKSLLFALCVTGICALSFPLKAQIVDRLYKTDYHIDPGKERELSVELDNISFFKDNEFTGEFTDGYSLPGLWLQPKAVYYPLRNVKVEAGLHLLIYHGANKYPSMAYQDIAYWKGTQYQKGIHVLPYFRAQMSFADHWNVVLGALYGGANHDLIEPLYNPELNMTADPEMGLQVLFDSKPFNLDIWVNWQSFIFRKDLHQEAFTVGISSRLKYNDPSSRFHFYTPIQGLVQHRGGEIDTIYSGSVQTLMNGAIGVGAIWNTGHHLFKNVGLELDAAGYYQQAGELWPLGSGYGLYARASASIYDFLVKTSYWRGDDFIPMFGSQLYGSVANTDKGGAYKAPQLLYLGLEYSKQLAKGFSIGADLDIFYHLSVDRTDLEGVVHPEGKNTSFSVGVYMRVNPSFLIKKF